MPQVLVFYFCPALILSFRLIPLLLYIVLSRDTIHMEYFSQNLWWLFWPWFFTLKYYCKWTWCWICFASMSVHVVIRGDEQGLHTHPQCQQTKQNRLSLYCPVLRDTMNLPLCSLETLSSWIFPLFLVQFLKNVLSIVVSCKVAVHVCFLFYLPM